MLPVMVTAAIGLAVLGTLQALARIFGIWCAALCGGLVLLAAGGVAAGIAVAAKWLLVGRIRAGEFPLWSPFVWRNELADTFVETVRGAVVRARGQRHAGHEHVAARTGSQGRSRCLV